MNNTLITEVTNIISQPIVDLGFTIVKISLLDSNLKNLEILIERIDENPVSIEDCTLINKYISTLLQVNGILQNDYSLTVSSAGAERPLVTIEDYKRFIGREVKIKLRQPINNTSKLQGKILKTINNEIVIEINHDIINLNFDMIKKANLVLTEEMFKKLLNKNKNK